MQPRRLRHTEDWRALSTINAYRCLIAAGLAGTHFSPFLQPLLAIARVPLFEFVSVLYLLCCATSVACTTLRHPPLRVQTGLFSILDIGFLACLVFASAGVASGLGVLLIVPVACAGALLSARAAVSIAALATCAILAVEVLRPLVTAQTDTAIFQASILGVLFFTVAALAQWLARQLRTTQAMVAAHSGTVRNLTALNQRIIEDMTMGAMAVDSRHHIQLTNAAAVQLLDLPGAPTPGTPLAQAAPTLSHALEHWLRTPSGSPASIVGHAHTLLPHFSILPTLSGGNTDSATSILVFLEDAQRQSEQAQQLKLVALGRLSAGIAHEIRNPLSAISHATQLLEESSTLTIEDRKLLRIIHRHSQRIDRIVEDVMGLSRRNGTDQPPMQLRAWLQDTVDEYRHLHTHAPTLQLQDIDADQVVHFNPSHLRRILFNLWHNAEHHARCPGTALHVTLSGCHDARGTFCLDSTDNGPGIDTAAIGRIMEPFYTTGDDGIGLGLHLARELCEANGARLLPLAAADGACFRIMFAAPAHTDYD